VKLSDLIVVFVLDSKCLVLHALRYWWTPITIPNWVRLT